MGGYFLTSRLVSIQTHPTMRPLTEEETKAVFEKLANYIGKNLVHLIDRDEDDEYCFRLHKDRYVLFNWTPIIWTGLTREWL